MLIWRRSRERSGQHPQLADDGPRRRASLDRRLTLRKANVHRRQPAAHRRRRDVVAELDLDVAPLALVGLVADGEIEQLAAMLGGVAHNVHELDRAGPEPRQVAVVVTGQDVVIAAAEDQSEVRRGGLVADVEPAHMGQAGASGTGREIEKEVAVAGLLEHVGHAKLGVGPALFVDQGIDGAHHAVAIARGDEASFAVIGKAIVLLAVGLRVADERLAANRRPSRRRAPSDRRR